MEYKISQLVSMTGMPKSTILYYIREGMLPEAKKIKSNVHVYNDEHLELIKYIKYMKNSIGSSNDDIKIALKNKNSSLATSFTMIEPLMNTLSLVSKNDRFYTKEEFIGSFKINEKLLDKLIDDGLIVSLHDDRFTEKDVIIIRLVESFEQVGLQYEILKQYMLHAKEISKLERKMQEQLCKVRTDDNFTTLWEIMFDTLFKAKEYVFNRYTYKTFLKAIMEDKFG
ncbi:MerR family transcriptional regulator [Sulfurimonas sp. HSL-1716]|uniref:MerR family transcriptional regulator n=1 Tax=Hydrocurvibacter sulfurireducens TaxID=3131937 RepID=UPI0031F8EF3B